MSNERHQLGFPYTVLAVICWSRYCNCRFDREKKKVEAKWLLVWTWSGVINVDMFGDKKQINKK